MYKTVLPKNLRPKKNVSASNNVKIDQDEVFYNEDDYVPIDNIKSSKEVLEMKQTEMNEVEVDDSRKDSIETASSGEKTPPKY